MRGSRLVLIVLAACGGTRYRTELVGHGNGVISSRAPLAATDLVAAPGAGGIQLPQGNYELAMRFDVPRAQIVEWKIACPGVDLDGQVGETFEQYRAQRPDAPADDLGRGTLVASARVMTAGDGVCALHASADDTDVRAAFTVTRIRDVDAADRMKTIAAREVAVKTRGELTARLVTAGASPVVRQARLDAESADARVRFDARIAADAQVRAKADIRARLEGEALEARWAYLAYLSGKCHAEAGRRDRIADEERQRREARLVAYAEIADRRDRAALQARAELRAQLLRWGAKGRPPMPAPKPEEPGTPPFDGAAWTAGYWSWESGDWAWQDGGWSEPDVFGERTAGIGVHVPPSPGVRDHRRERSDPPTWTPSRQSSHESSRTRDHRDDSSSRVRDHRSKDDDKQDDDKPRVRDHR